MLNKSQSKPMNSGKPKNF